MVCVLEQVVNWKVYVHGYCNTKDVFLFFFFNCKSKTCEKCQGHTTKSRDPTQITLEGDKWTNLSSAAGISGYITYSTKPEKLV